MSLTSPENRYRWFVEQYQGEVRHNEKLSPYTSFRTGGPADLFVEIVSREELIRAVKLATEAAIPYFVIGGGSNLLVSDQGYRGLIIRNQIMGLSVKDDEILAGAGESLNQLVDYATECSLSGLEFGAGIWGTVGGAIYGNAGAFGSQIGSVLKYAELIDDSGKIRTESRAYFDFGYRHSRLKKTKEVICAACFELDSKPRSEIEEKTTEIRQRRRRSHPTTPCSAGCFFKNIEDPSQPNGKLAAGKLLEEVGAKETKAGRAAVFEGHANIIINGGGASSKEIRQLADILKQKVKDRFNIELQEEVICLGDFH